MDDTGLLTVSQELKARGGKLATRIEGCVVRVEIDVGGIYFRGITSLDLPGIRTFESLFAEAMYEPAAITPQSVGLDLEYITRNFEGKTFSEKMEDLQARIHESKKAQCAHGFVQEHGGEEGRASDMVRGSSHKVYRANNERDRSIMTAVQRMHKIDGEWDGMVFTRSGEKNGCTCVQELTTLVEKLESESPVELLGDEGQAGILEIAEDAAVSWEEKFFELCDVAVSAWTTEARERLFWAGGVRIGRRSLCSTIFTKDQELPFARFFEEAIRRCIAEWEFNKKKEERGYSSVEALVFGQMIQVRSQLRVNRGRRTVQFIPVPPASLARMV